MSKFNVGELSSILATFPHYGGDVAEYFKYVDDDHMGMEVVSSNQVGEALKDLGIDGDSFDRLKQAVKDLPREPGTKVSTNWEGATEPQKQTVRTNLTALKAAVEQRYAQTAELALSTAHGGDPAATFADLRGSGVTTEGFASMAQEAINLLTGLHPTILEVPVATREAAVQKLEPYVGADFVVRKPLSP